MSSDVIEVKGAWVNPAPIFYTPETYEAFSHAVGHVESTVESFKTENIIEKTESLRFYFQLLVAAIDSLSEDDKIKILEETNDYLTLTGQDFSVGGKGINNLYDLPFDEQTLEHIVENTEELNLVIIGITYHLVPLPPKTKVITKRDPVRLRHYITVNEEAQ